MDAVFFQTTSINDRKSLLEAVKKTTARNTKHFNIHLLLSKTGYLHLTARKFVQY